MVIIMSNYVWSRIICGVDTLEDIIIGDPTNILHSYISFKRLQIDDDDTRNVLVNKLTDNSYELKYCQRWFYPITAIIRLIEKHHDVIWYLVEENHLYVSKFYWDNSVKEDIMDIEQDYYVWLDKYPTFDELLDYSDDDVWYFLETIKEKWVNWDSQDSFSRYLNTAVYKIEKPFKNNN